jgi:hypothetical protein
MKQKHITILACLTALLIAAASISSTRTPESLATTNTETQEERLLHIANVYRSYSKYVSYTIQQNDSVDTHWAMVLCAPQATSPLLEDSIHISQASPKSSKHGNKLYKLFLKDLKAYTDPKVRSQPLGQVIVKETWNVRSVSKDSLSKFGNSIQENLNDGKWYTPTTRSGLFIMYKEETSELNDQGWVYGILNLDNSPAPTVLEKGKISSCIKCHSGTKYDRIFGTE